MLHKLQITIADSGCTGAAVIGFAGVDEAQAQWKPTKTVEFIVPAGTGGGADQMARMIQGIIQKHNLMEQSLVVVNKAGGSGGEGFLDMKDSAGNPHKIIITLSSLFTTPLATGIPFSWEDLTPVAMLALDEFVLWVNAESPAQDGTGIYRCRQGCRRPVRHGRHRLQAGGPDHHGRPGAGDRREAQIHLRKKAAATSPRRWSAITSIRR